MPTPSTEIVQLLACFASAMTAPSFSNALVLLYGAILAPGRRTVAAALRVMGKEHDPHFSNYHRFFNRACWAPMLLSFLLLGLLVRRLVPEGVPLRILVDETLELRAGPKVAYRSWFRDALRSSAAHVHKALGVRWLCCCLLVRLPWSRREWALPFLVMPTLSESQCKKLGKRHRSSVEWAGWVLGRIRRWYPERPLIAVGDGLYASLPLVEVCQGLPRPVTLVARSRWNARLFDEPGPQPNGKPGRKPKKGARQPHLSQRLVDPQTKWKRVTLGWYGGERRTVQVTTGTALWHRGGHEPRPVRWVIVGPLPADEAPFDPAAILCSDTGADPAQIVAWFVGRWNIEVTFEELRAHLRFGTQRHWSQRAVERTTPCLFGVFSLVVLIAHTLHPQRLPVAHSSWYPKQEATFADALAAVRAHLWTSWDSVTGAAEADHCQIPRSLFQRLHQIACRAV
jgi:DDE superfamily endonuclease